MSNERIELTQFENISSEGWEYLSDESRDINDAALDKIPDLIAELKRCYNELDIHGIGISFDPKHNEEDEEILTQWLEATTQGYYGSVYEYKYDITASE